MIMQVIRKHDLQLASDFFFIFARFEYALKAAGFHNVNGEAKVNWLSFAEKVQPLFNSLQPGELTNAVQYYLKYPPKKQMIINGHLEWKDVEPATNLLADKVLQYIRRVRNNLFHGGKFKGQYFAEPDRSETLIRHGLAIIDACMSFAPEVREAYENGSRS